MTSSSIGKILLNHTDTNLRSQEFGKQCWTRFSTKVSHFQMNVSFLMVEFFSQRTDDSTQNQLENSYQNKTPRYSNYNQFWVVMSCFVFEVLGEAGVVVAVCCPNSMFAEESPPTRAELARKPQMGTKTARCVYYNQFWIVRSCLCRGTAVS